MFVKSRNQTALLHRLVASAAVFCCVSAAFAQGPDPRPKLPTGPWMDRTLSADRRADLLLKEMSLDEKISLVHGFRPFSGDLPAGAASSRSLGGAGFIPGIERLGIPDLQMADSAAGVTKGAVKGRYSTPLPSTLAASSSWNVEAAYDYGALIGRELRNQGYNMSLAGGVNITRDPRNGRNFEYAGEDPILAGTLVGSLMQGMQAQHMMGDIKHYAVNDQETGRNIVNAILDKRSLRESDLLAFEIALHRSDASAVMCSYNKINGDWACENQYLLNDVLKNTWGFKGFVLSDWGGTHTTQKAALAGLDMEMPGSNNFGDPLKQAIAEGKVPQSRLDDMVHRILRSEIASGVFDDRPVPAVPDVLAGLALSRSIEEQGIVLLKNDHALLPLAGARLKRVLVVGSHADVGVLSGGGSAQVDPPGGNAVAPAANTATTGVAGSFTARGAVWMPSSPLKALRAAAPSLQIDFDPGTDAVAAAKAAAAADAVIVFVNQPMSEGRDGDFSLPEHQDDLVAAIAAANKHTAVVLETGGPVAMPWSGKVDAIVEMWFPGIEGGEAIAAILTGAVNPSGKLAVTFPKAVADLPHPALFGIDQLAAQAAAQAALQSAPPTNGPASGGGGRAPLPPFDATYSEGLLVGYKWYDEKKIAPLFPFGHGLSYTTYHYSGAKASHSQTIDISFDVKNDGGRAGTEVSQVYVALPAQTGEPPKRLVGWSRTELKPGESKSITLHLDPHYFAIFNTSTDSWEIVDGDYVLMVGGGSDTLPLQQKIHLNAQQLKPLLAE